MPFLIFLNLVVFPEYSSYLRHHCIGIRKYAVAYYIDRTRILLIYNLMRYGPVAEIPASVVSLAPVLEDAVNTVCLSVFYPFLHVWIVPVDKASVSVVDVSMPCGRNDESTPVWTATCRIWVWSSVRHTSVRTLAICPCSDPVHIQRSYVADSLKCRS